ncbi:MAG: SAM-dependent methyltransferase [Alphaproteobacteria bacterium]|nr:SAM-dependent methyltransferase [Alphaproteobacteria bacterium]
MSVAEWINACLADPAHGYYRRVQPIGKSGDFTTAPEISQIFGELIGAWCAEVWAMLGRPRTIRLVELGPGRGTLMADMLRAVMRPAQDFFQAIDLHLVEINLELRRIQKKTIDRNAMWHDTIDTVPPGPMIVVGNEFLDALPVRQLVRSTDGWRERHVTHADGRFDFTLGPVVESPALEPAHLKATIGDVVETSDVARTLVSNLARRIRRQTGAALFIDYGPLASGIGETLQAVSQHQRADPLERPGEVDLTTHVDFAALARVARLAGAKSWGPIPQGIFLTRLGLHARAAMLTKSGSQEERRTVERGAGRLVDDSEMGTLFKALALTHPDFDGTPPGFDPPSPNETSPKA